MTTVFISHSAKEPVARELLAELVAALKDNGFDPYVDYERLENGQLWWEELQRHVKSAHAVIVLVSKSALTSVPVLQEVTLAMSERVDSRGLERVFPLFAPDVSYDEVEKCDLRRTGLHTVQAKQLDDVAAVRRIVPTMLAAIHETYRSRKTVELVAALETWLGTAGRAALELAAERLGLRDAELRSANLVTAVAQRLLEFTGDAVAGVVAVESFLEVVPPTGQRARLVELVLSAASLPESVHAQVEAVLGDPARDVVCAAVDEVRTGAMYLRRACLSWAPWTTHVADSAGSSGYLESLITGIRQHLLDEVLCFGDDNPTDTEFLDELRDYEKRHGPATVTVPAPPDPQLVRQLRGRFPLVLFVFVAGSTAVEQPVNGVRWLDPALTRRVERLCGQVRKRHESAAG